MLQASTGKLFTYPIGHSNLLRGVLYTNMDILGHDEVNTVFGKILPLSMHRQPNVISCEIVENIERVGEGPGILHSNGIDIYLNDFADIVSFSLNVICTPDVDLASRLLSGQPRAGTTSPNKLLTRIFDKSVIIKQDDLITLKIFTTELLGLSREKYLIAIKAIRTYITALHRLADDLDLSYTLLVMSTEALVQKFSDFQTQWSDVEEVKRKPIEVILKELNTETSARLKAAIVQNEHLALSKKFKHFILANLPESYFTDDAALQTHPIGRKDLESALQNLYKTRSKYVHELQALPKEFTHFAGPTETVVIGDEMLLSFQGLTRLAKAVIKEFVRKQKKIDKDPCDYSLENPNLVRMKMCPSTWVTNASQLNKDNCSIYFTGFVSLLDEYYNDYPNKKIYDMRGIIELGFSLKHQLKAQQRLSIFAIAVIFESLVTPQYAPKITMSEQDFAQINSPSIESLIGHTVLGIDTEWSVTEHEIEFENYYQKRLKKSGFRLPHKLEACLGLALTERYRATGDHESAQKILSLTADNFPSLKAVRELSINYDPTMVINWIKIVYPNTIKTHPESDLECIGL
jgi:hypothetical protein